MAMANDEEFIKDLIKHKEETIAWFGQAGKQERERYIFRGFVRALGLTFDIQEIKSITAEYPDVEFRGAHFEIKEMLDPDRRRHDEYKNALERLKETKDIRSQLQHYKPDFVTFDEVTQKIDQVVNNLTGKYPTDDRAGTNLLIYFNLQDIILDKTTCGPNTLESKDWRSVSVVGNSWCHVFASSPEAPEYITRNVAKFRQGTGLWD